MGLQLMSVFPARLQNKPINVALHVLLIIIYYLNRGFAMKSLLVSVKNKYLLMNAEHVKMDSI